MVSDAVFATLETLPRLKEVTLPLVGKEDAGGGVSKTALARYRKANTAVKVIANGEEGP
jgi:hypothetical protein